MPHPCLPAVALLVLLSGLMPRLVLAQPVNKVMVAAAAEQDLPMTTALVGTTRPHRRTLIGSEMEGLVTAFDLREGDRVAAGATLCQLDARLPELRVQAAEQRLESLRAALDAAKAEMTRWTRERERLRALDRSQQAHQKELYDTEAEYGTALARVQEVTALIATQEAEWEQLRVQLARTQITAPFAGCITRLHTELGAWMPRGGAVVELIELDPVVVRIDLPESALPYVEVGGSVSVRLDALSMTRRGTIRQVIPQADERARTFPVDIELSNPERRILSGLFARATVSTGPAQRTVAVLKDAIVDRPQGLVVYVIRRDGEGPPMAVPTPVTTGAEVGVWIAITSANIRPGDPIVVRGNERLMPFPAPVEILEEDVLLEDGGLEAVRGDAAGGSAAGHP